MNTTTSPQSVTRPSSTTAPARPGRGRRAALAVAGFLNCALPVIFTANVSRMLVTGVEPEHRFHQATGQGLLLFALWLGCLVPLLRAGWAGRRPSSRAGVLHMTFIATGAICAALAPGGGAPFLVGVIAVTGALLWAVLPVRPTLRMRAEVDPLLAPFGLVLAAFLLPYAADQITLQNAVTDPDHLQNPHLFDMAWLAAAIMVLGILSAFLPAVRGLGGWAAGCTLGLGAAGLAFTDHTSWSLIAAALGLAGSALLILQSRFTR